MGKKEQMQTRSDSSEDILRYPSVLILSLLCTRGISETSYGNIVKKKDKTIGKASFALHCFYKRSLYETLFL